MTPHDALPKANVYVDGFNLFAGNLYKTKGCKWLNLRLLAEQLFPDLDIQTIKYFTAEISVDPSDPGASGRQRAYWRALQTDPDLVIIKGNFFSKNKRKPLANPLPRGNCTEPDCPKGDQHAIVRITEEKMSDVNLATHLLKDGFLGLYDVAIDNRSNRPEPDFVFCAWRTNDAKHDMTPQHLRGPAPIVVEAWGWA